MIRTRLATPTVVTALSAVLLVALVLLTWFALSQRSDASELEAAEETDRAVLAAARSSTLAFTNVDYRTMDEDIEAVLETATGTFEKQFEQSAPQLTKLSKRNQSVSEGRVLNAGLVSRDSDSARAIVVADTTVENKLTDEPQPRHFRFQVDLVLEDGEWLTSNLEFVG